MKDVIPKTLKISNKLGIRLKEYILEEKGIVRLETTNLKDTLLFLYLIKDFSWRRKEIEKKIRDLKSLSEVSRKRKYWEKAIKEVEENETLKKILKKKNEMPVL